MVKKTTMMMKNVKEVSQKEKIKKMIKKKKKNALANV